MTPFTLPLLPPLLILAETTFLTPEDDERLLLPLEADFLLLELLEDEFSSDLLEDEDEEQGCLLACLPLLIFDSITIELDFFILISEVSRLLNILYFDLCGMKSMRTFSLRGLFAYLP